MSVKYPENVIRIAKILAASGYKAYAVGGCMRDAIMGRIPNDWDMTTDCSPEKMIEIFENAGVRTIPTGLKHGTVSVILDNEIYECTTFRIDGSYTDSRSALRKPLGYFLHRHITVAVRLKKTPYFKLL
jgi:tRNA nucleotidyltransferase (CCA-adding enzyme)